MVSRTELSHAVARVQAVGWPQQLSTLVLDSYRMREACEGRVVPDFLIPYAIRFKSTPHKPSIYLLGAVLYVSAITLPLASDPGARIHEIENVLVMLMRVSSRPSLGLSNLCIVYGLSTLNHNLENS